MNEKKLSSKFGVSLAAFIGFAATSIAVIAVPMLLNEPKGRSEYFWYRVAWSEFLVTLVWIYLSGFISLVFPRYRSQKGLGAILPSIGVVIFIYALSSFAFMLLETYLPSFKTINLVSQVCLAAIAIVILVFIHFSRVSGITGTENVVNAPSPKKLILEIANQENHLSEREFGDDIKADQILTLERTLKELKESIAYSIQQVGGVEGNEAYQVFSKNITELCNDCADLNSETQQSKIQTLIQRSMKFKGEVKNIALQIRQE